MCPVPTCFSLPTELLLECFLFMVGFLLLAGRDSFTFFNYARNYILHTSIICVIYANWLLTTDKIPYLYQIQMATLLFQRNIQKVKK